MQNHFVEKRERTPLAAEISYSANNPLEELHVYLETSTCQLAINK